MRPAVLLLTCLLLLSCSREQERPPAPAAPGKSMFEEVRDQTIRDPNDAEAWFHLADLYDRTGAYREEVEALKKVIALDPKRGSAYARLGTAYQRLGQYQDAVEALQKAIKHAPRNAVLYNNLAASYGKTGREREEIEALTKAISLRPRYATARYNLGVVLLRRGDRAGALRQYEELAKFDDGVAAALKKEIDSERGNKP